MASGMSRGQRVMRDEMLAGKVLDEVIGEASAPSTEISRYGEQQRRAHDLVLDIIDQYTLVLSLSQWQVVQNMMEQAVMTGVQLEQDL
jgi:hypothetical protein